MISAAVDARNEVYKKDEREGHVEEGPEILGVDVPACNIVSTYRQKSSLTIPCSKILAN